jgi:hypothetical protein
MELLHQLRQEVLPLVEVQELEIEDVELPLIKLDLIQIVLQTAD